MIKIPPSKTDAHPSGVFTTSVTLLGKVKMPAPNSVLVRNIEVCDVEILSSERVNTFVPPGSTNYDLRCFC
ncbi:hypothetical protein D3C81_1075690 [compost metagenome]